MAQFDLFANRRSKTYPFLVDIQADLLRSLATRVVAPLAPLSKIRGKPVARLNPVVSIDGHDHAVLFQELAAIPMKELGSAVGDLRDRRGELVAALDLLFTGI